MGKWNMQSKIDALTAPATVVAGSSFFSLNYFMEEGLPVLVQLGNAGLIMFGLLLAISKWRTSRVERKILQLELKQKQKDAGE